MKVECISGFHVMMVALGRIFAGLFGPFVKIVLFFVHLVWRCFMGVKEYHWNCGTSSTNVATPS